MKTSIPTPISAYDLANIRLENMHISLAQGDYTMVLASGRYALESILRDFFKRNAERLHYTGESIALFDMIYMLSAADLLSKDETQILHRLSRLGNKGAHICETSSSQEDAVEMIELLTAALNFMIMKV